MEILRKLAPRGRLTKDEGSIPHEKTRTRPARILVRFAIKGVTLLTALVLLVTGVSAQTQEQDFRAAKAEYESSPHSEGDRSRYVRRLTDMLLDQAAAKHKDRTILDAYGYGTMTEEIHAELTKHPAPESSDSKQLDQLVIGKWASPRHVYVFTADHRYGMEEAPKDETWQIRGTQMTLGSDTYTIILLDAKYLVLSCETGALFYTRVKRIAVLTCGIRADLTRCKPALSGHMHRSSK